YQGGSLLSEDGGITIMGGRGEGESASGITVNAFLWRAALDTLSFVPIASADPFGGVIISDWYSQPEYPNERLKLNVFVLSRQLRADGVRVRAFKQTKNDKGDWVDAPVSENVPSSLEETILTRARQMRLTHEGGK
ncbi:MAG: DUF3576 domain-containing protein, partial [Alphaproteobacteria bacterium]|nr:DUF3576 domain-containing protein [Alphaproteobacteria bacterium]